MLVVSREELLNLLTTYVGDLRQIDGLTNREFAEDVVKFMYDCKVIKTMIEDYKEKK